ncbi:hypothetical protein ND748_28900, partial [Frankia sp. AiPs1]|nr:hypothetical protein [Frankia sp. AiPs1]
PAAGRPDERTPGAPRRTRPTLAKRPILAKQPAAEARPVSEARPAAEARPVFEARPAAEVRPVFEARPAAATVPAHGADTSPTWSGDVRQTAPVRSAVRVPTPPTPSTSTPSTPNSPAADSPPAGSHAPLPTNTPPRRGDRIVARVADLGRRETREHDSADQTGQDRAGARS